MNDLGSFGFNYGHPKVVSVVGLVISVEAGPPFSAPEPYRA